MGSKHVSPGGFHGFPKRPPSLALEVASQALGKALWGLSRRTVLTLAVWKAMNNKLRSVITFLDPQRQIRLGAFQHVFTLLCFLTSNEIIDPGRC